MVLKIKNIILIVLQCCLLFFSQEAFTAEPLKPEIVVAQALKTCQSNFDNQPKNSQALKAWHRLAQAQVNIGDVKGAIESLNKANTDPAFSVASAYVMQLEATGIVPPEIEKLKPEHLAIVRMGAINVLINLAEYEKAIEQANAIPEDKGRELTVLKTQLRIARIFCEEQRFNGALKIYPEIIKSVETLDNAIDSLDCMEEICSGLLLCGFDMGAAPVVNNIESLLAQGEGKLNPNKLALRWLTVGKFWLLMDDEELAKTAFEKSEKLYKDFIQAKSGVEWDQSLLKAMLYDYRCHAYLRLNKQEDAIKTLTEWRKSLKAKKVDDNFIRECSALASKQFLAKQDQEATAAISMIPDASKRTIGLEYLKNEAEGFGNKDYGNFIAQYSRDHFQDKKQILSKVYGLALAVQSHEKLGALDAMKKCLSEIEQLSNDNDKFYHAELAALLAKQHDYDHALELIKKIEIKAKKAQAIVEFAVALTQENCEKKLTPEIEKRKSRVEKSKLIHMPKLKV